MEKPVQLAIPTYADCIGNMEKTCPTGNTDMSWCIGNLEITCPTGKPTSWLHWKHENLCNWHIISINVIYHARLLPCDKMVLLSLYQIICHLAVWDWMLLDWLYSILFNVRQILIKSLTWECHCWNFFTCQTMQSVIFLLVSDRTQVCSTHSCELNNYPDQVIGHAQTKLRLKEGQHSTSLPSELVQLLMDEIFCLQIACYIQHVKVFWLISSI